MKQEYQNILTDYDFLKRLPNNINCGFFLVELGEIKSLLLTSLNQLISRLNRLFEKTISEVLIKNSKVYDEFMLKLTKEPKTLEEYIEVKSYLNGQLYERNCDELTTDMKFLIQCIATLDIFLIEVPENLVEKCYISIAWIEKIEVTRKNADIKLEEMKPKMKKIIEEKKKRISDEYEELKRQIMKFSEYYSLADAYDISSLSKEIYSALKKLMEKGRSINAQEEFLKFSTTNFEGLQNLMDDFDKYHNLWDFAEKWKFVFFYILEENFIDL